MPLYNRKKEDQEEPIPSANEQQHKEKFQTEELWKSLKIRNFNLFLDFKIVSFSFHTIFLCFLCINQQGIQWCWWIATPMRVELRNWKVWVLGWQGIFGDFRSSSVWNFSLCCCSFAMGIGSSWSPFNIFFHTTFTNYFFSASMMGMSNMEVATILRTRNCCIYSLGFNSPGLQHFPCLLYIEYIFPI
jgi:hypothetical protein